VTTRARAVAEAVQALPLGWALAWPMRAPGVAQLLGLVYDAVAARRMRISVAMGKGACGVPVPDEERAAFDPSRLAPPAPAKRLARVVTGVLRDAAVAVIFAAMIVQTMHENDLALGYKLEQPRWLAAVAGWPRMMARWGVMAKIPTEDEVMVVDAQTKGGRSVDPLTGREPVWNPGAMRGTGLGQIWNDYLARMHEREWFEFQRAFRDYLARSGPKWADPTGDDVLTGLDAYWVKQPIPRPGEPRAEAVSAREKMFTQSRGGRAAFDRALPVIRPELLHPR
jgi:hypothetical protein